MRSPGIGKKNCGDPASSTDADAGAIFRAVAGRAAWVGALLLFCSMWALGTAPRFASEAGILARITPPVFPERDFVITDFGARRGEDSTGALQRAIQACHAARGGRVVVPDGTFLTGALALKSNVNLHLADGAVLKFIPHPEKYPLVFSRWEGVECLNYSALLYSQGEQNVAITGRGTLDGSATAENWLKWNAPAWEDAPTLQDPDRARLFAMGRQNLPVAQRVFGGGAFLRPNFIQIYRGKNILIEGVTIVNSPMWAIHPVLCQNVIVRGVTVRSHGRNNDGCNPESCRDVLIEDCVFDTGDDCIALKSGRNEDGRRIGVPAENIVIRRCRMEAGHGAFTIGSEISGGCRNVYASDLTIDAAHLDHAFRFKSNAARGGTIENIHIRNVTIGRVAKSVLSVEFTYEDAETGRHPPVLRNLTIRNVNARSCERVLNLRGFPGAVVSDILLKDCTFLEVEKGDRIRDVRAPSRRHVVVRMKER